MSSYVIINVVANRCIGIKRQNEWPFLQVERDLVPEIAPPLYDFMFIVTKVRRVPNDIDKAQEGCCNLKN